MEICKLTKLFEKTFGPGNGLRAFTAPGRVNLIGEHIDYCGGKVLPAALTLSNTVLVRANGTRTVRMCATDLEGIYTFSLDDIDSARGLRWGAYQAGVAKELTQAGFRLTGVDMLWDSTLPFGSGLSSSASIELAAGIAFASLAENGLDTVNTEDRIALAVAGQRAENRFCGVNCGIMDQFASAMGRRGHAVLLDCATLDYEYVPLELGKYSLVLANTRKKHALGASKYNERRAEVARGLELMHEALPDNKQPELCGYTVSDFEAARAALANEPVISSRVEHVIYENARVYRAKEALSSGKLKEFGEILRRANDSIRRLYEVTGDELDAMFDEAQDLDYCIGSRMTGAGFGGCTVNIVETARTGEFCETLGKRYTARTGLTPEFYICSIGDGVRELELD